MRASIVIAGLLLVALVCITEGAKQTSNVKKCKDCSDDYTPVCGMIGGTKDKPKVTRFGNKCVLEKVRCEKNQEIPELPASACGPTAPERLQ